MIVYSNLLHSNESLFLYTNKSYNTSFDKNDTKNK